MDEKNREINLCGETVCSIFNRLKVEEKKASVCRYVYGFTRRELRSFGLSPVVLEVGVGAFAPDSSDEDTREYTRQLTGLILLRRYKSSFLDLFGGDFEKKVSGILKRRERNAGIRKLGKRCLLASLALLLSFLSVMAFSEDLRVDLISGAVNHWRVGSFIDVRYAAEESRNQLAAFSGPDRPQVIPRDYYVEKILNSKYYYLIQYRSAVEETACITFSEMFGENYNVMLTTQNAGVAYCDVNGRECMRIIGNQSTMLAWKQDSDTLIQIQSFNNQALDLQVFAESVN